MLSLNAQCRLQGITTLARGRTDEESIDGQQVAEAAMRYQAHSVILANNHMGGELKPREGEIRATQKVANVLGGNRYKAMGSDTGERRRNAWIE